MNRTLKFGLCAICSRSVRPSMLTRCTGSNTNTNRVAIKHFDISQTAKVSSLVWTFNRGMAGHSKWQNIRHTKEAKDAERGRKAAAINRKIKIAVKDGGSTDPKLNHLLARVIDEANRLDIPKVNIQNAIKQVEKQNKESSLLTLECRGPGNCMLIVECMTSKVKYMRQTLSGILNKVGGSVLEKGIAMHHYERKGVVLCELSKDTPMDQDQAEEIAIEVEAEEVSISTHQSEAKSMRFICDMKDMKIVKDNLVALGYTVSANLEYLPTICVNLNEKELKLTEFMFDKMEELEEVVKIYDNIEVS